ncbi:MAG: hypothetical protein EOO88_62505 [Pedobacter sp.]|nr:MAG: hypothetical protein EOO88_62505 [Pedobacter sp.]
MLVYGTRLSGGRHNIVSWAREKLEAGEAIKVVHDQFRTPTYVGDLAAGVILAVVQKARGIYHVSGTTMMTPYDMVVQVATQWNFDKTLITAVTASTFKEIAERPKRTGFVCDKAINELGYRPRLFTDILKQIH